MKYKLNQHHTDGLAALLLFGVFAVCIMMVLLTGADAYRRLTQRDQSGYVRRTCVQYITTRVRQADTLGGIEVRHVEDTDVLVLGANEEYVTYIYCLDGWLMELYTWSGEPLVLTDGWQLMEAGGMDLALEDDMLSVHFTSAQGAEDTLALTLRSGEGAAA